MLGLEDNTRIALKPVTSRGLDPLRTVTTREDIEQRSHKRSGVDDVMESNQQGCRILMDEQEIYFPLNFE